MVDYIYCNRFISFMNPNFLLHNSPYVIVNILSLLNSIYFRFINPVVISPTVAAVGLSFFSYGFAKIGTCIEMGILQLLMVVIFALVSMQKSHYQIQCNVI
jgi:ABC-type transport system involved in cytochrome bd biosynthesis fused ATPase/permease subunit